MNKIEYRQQREVKMAVIFCDTDCELWHTTAKELGVEVIKMPYSVEIEEYYYDLGEKTDIADFFSQMEKGAKVSTAGLNEQTYIDYFEPYFKKGEDILYIAFSSKMSSTFLHMDNAVQKLSKKYPNVKFVKFDTLNISLGAGILVYLGAKYFKEHNQDIEKTCEYLTSIRDKVEVLFVVNDLKYLARGGRISKAKATIANIMNVKPILTVNKEGEIDVATKVNGSKKAFKYLVNKVIEEYSTTEDAPIFLVDTISNNMVDKLEEEILQSIKAKVVKQPIGPVIGAHCGPGTFGIIYIKK